VVLGLQYASSKSWIDLGSAVRSAQEVAQCLLVDIAEPVAAAASFFVADLQTMVDHGAEYSGGRTDQCASQSNECYEQRRTSRLSRILCFVERRR